MRRGLVERGLLDRTARLVVRRGALASRLQPVQVEQPLGARVALEHLERSRGCGALRLGRAPRRRRGSARRLRAARRASGRLGRSPSSSTSSRPAERSVS